MLEKHKSESMMIEARVRILRIRNGFLGNDPDIGAYEFVETEVP